MTTQYIVYEIVLAVYNRRPARNQVIKVTPNGNGKFFRRY